jgi:type II secretory pathway pseudopilin PulG
MAVVVITGILAAVGTTMFRSHILASRTIETTSMIRSIAAAQERFRGENLTYFDVSNGNLAAYYPSATVGATKYDWTREHTHAERWALLNPTVSGPVQYGYACIAGGPGTGVPAPAALQIAAEWTGNFVMPWYVIQAIGDVDEDGVPSYYVGASYTSQIFTGGDPE